MSDENQSVLSLLLLQAEDLIERGELVEALDVFKRIQSQGIGPSLVPRVEQRISQLEANLGRHAPGEQSTLGAPWVCHACKQEVSAQHAICPYCELGLIDGTVIESVEPTDESERVKRRLPGWLLVAIGAAVTLAITGVLGLPRILEGFIRSTELTATILTPSAVIMETSVSTPSGIHPSATSTLESTPLPTTAPSPTAFPQAWMDDAQIAVAAWRERVDLDQMETQALTDAREQVEILEDLLASMGAAYVNEQYESADRYLDILQNRLAPTSLEWRPDRRGDFWFDCDSCETREIDGTIVEDTSDYWTMVPSKFPEIPADFTLSIRYKATGLHGEPWFEFRRTGWQGEGVMYEFGIGACPVESPPDFRCLYKLVSQPYPIHFYQGCNVIKPSYGNWHEMNITAVGNMIEIWEDGFLVCRYKDPNPILFGDLKIFGYYLQLESVELEWHQLGSISP